MASVLCLVGCVGAPPIEDYVIANTAMDAAKYAQASKYAPGLYTQAEDFYKRAIVDYEDRRYDSSQMNFRRAKEFAEKAENYTVLKKAEGGEL